MRQPIPPLLSIAKQAGFTQQSFEQCLADQKLLDGIDQVRQRATEKFGVNSTPTFFINGKIAARRHIDRRHREADRALSQELRTGELAGARLVGSAPAGAALDAGSVSS